MKVLSDRLVARVLRSLAAACLLLIASLAVGPPSLGERSAGIDRASSLEQDTSSLLSTVAQGDGDNYYYLPLALKRFYRLPPWSGTARFGFCVASKPVEFYNTSRLHADWYANFGVRSDPPPLLDLEFVQTIRLSEIGYAPGAAVIEKYARAQPGTLWLVGNEPDAPAQDCVTPPRYAELYYEVYHLIKGADPGAKVAIGGVVQATPLRLEYLDLIWQEYQSRYSETIPVDVWNVHGFILQEKAKDYGCQIPCGLAAEHGMLYKIEDHDDMGIFEEQIVRFRQWMKDKGERDKPLVVSEYGILYPVQLGFDEPRVEQFMIATFDYFLNASSDSLGYPEDGNRLVQAWAWYSLDDEYFEGYESYSHLFDPDTKQITPLGQAYGNFSASH